MRTESFVRLFEQALPLALLVFSLILTVVVLIWYWSLDKRQ